MMRNDAKNREALMHAQARGPVLIDEGDAPDRLNRYLLSDRAPPDSMPLSTLDGFLTGIAVGPPAIDESAWLPVIFGNEEPTFADDEERDALIGTIRDRYDEIRRLISENELNPIFWVDRNGKQSAADWAAGFLEAMALRKDVWDWMVKSDRYGRMLDAILLAYRDENGERLVPLRDGAEELPSDDELANVVPNCVLAIARGWSRKQGKRSAVPSQDLPGLKRAAKVGRNDPCPCGSGNKVKKCCGKAA
jgi:uncharacterized protein